MLGKFSLFRHFAVATVIVGMGVLGATGLIGGGHHDEVVDHWQVVISPAGGEGLRIRETFDQDFGTKDRHGPERTIPNDYGVVSNVTASSPDAPDDLNVENFGSYTRIRVGDPDTTINGQHRYVIEYTLPAANLSSGLLAVDAIGDDYTIDMTEAEVIINGFELSNPECFTGPYGSTDACDIELVGKPHVPQRHRPPSGRKRHHCARHHRRRGRSAGSSPAATCPSDAKNPTAC